MSFSIARYFEHVSKTLARGPLPDSVESSMGRQLLLALSRMTARLAVDLEFGQVVKNEVAAMQLATLVEALPELRVINVAANVVTTIMAWQQESLAQRPFPPVAELERICAKAALLLCERGSATGIALANRLVEHELSGLRQIAALCNNILSVDAIEGGEKQRFSNEQLLNFVAFLKQVCAVVGDIRIIEVRQLPGGFSKQTFFVRLSASTVLPDELVIRYDPADSVFGVTVDTEFNILTILHAQGIRVAEPYALEMSGNVLGAPFMVTSRLHGGSIGDSYQVDGGSVAFGISLARELAKMHSVPPDAFGEKIYGANVDSRERLTKEIDSFQTLWQESGCTSIAMDCAFHWLKQHVDSAQGRRTLIHRDVGCHNLIVENNQVSGLVDWEAAAIGNPAQDLGYSMKTVVQVMPWHDFLAAYADAGGVIPSTEEITFYDLWGRVWIGVYAAQARKMFRSGFTDNIQLAYIGEHVFRRDLECVATALNRIGL